MIAILFTSTSALLHHHHHLQCHIILSLYQNIMSFNTDTAVVDCTGTGKAGNAKVNDGANEFCISDSPCLVKLGLGGGDNDSPLLIARDNDSSCSVFYVFLPL